MSYSAFSGILVDVMPLYNHGSYILIVASHFAENGTQTLQSSRQHGESKEKHPRPFASSLVGGPLNTGISLADRI